MRPLKACPFFLLCACVGVAIGCVSPDSTTGDTGTGGSRAGAGGGPGSGGASAGTGGGSGSGAASAGTGGGSGSGGATTGAAGTGGATTGTGGGAGSVGGTAGPNGGRGGTAAGGVSGAGGRGGAGAAAGTAGTAGVTGAGGSAGSSGGVGRGGSGGGAGTGAVSGRGGTGGGAGTGGVPSLYQKYATYFPIGAAVDSQSYTTHAPILKTHFNSVTCENEMKWDALEPTENSFSYGNADAIVNFATTNSKKVRGHTLVWYSQNPSWVFSNGSGGMATKDVLLARMKNHITKVMQHFQGKVYAWDVVNEAINNDGTYRDGTLADDKKSLWYQIIGQSYIAEAFKAAHAADANAKLFYNDYYDYIPAKRDGIYNMLKGLLDSGVTVHGVGLQTHLNIQPSTDMTNQAYYQNVADLEAAIVKYASLGLEVQITEMDVSLYIPGITYTSDMFYTAATFTDALQTQQAERYRAFFDMFRAHKDVITGVTLWGIADDNTWLSEFSSGRKDFPLLFDTNHQPKKAFFAVVDF
jgi:endo-1,4-beta-xylanase